jgi:hypothetical protein
MLLTLKRQRDYELFWRSVYFFGPFATVKKLNVPDNGGIP